jgi:hypothetical protein
MMIEDDVAFWDSWNEDFLEAETEEEDRRLEQRLAARHEADIEEMLRDLERDDPPHPGAPVDRARRRARRPTLAGALKEASKAGQHVAGAVIEDGKIELRFGEPGAAAVATSNPWDEEIARLKQ